MRLLLLFLSFVPFCLFAQRNTISGKIMDEKTRKPVIYANIGVVDKNCGTITDDKGNFVLENVPSEGMLKVSCIGYESTQISTMSVMGQGISVNLTPISYSLSEVTVKPQKLLQSKQVGRKKPSVAEFGWGGAIKGSEAGRLFDLDLKSNQQAHLKKATVFLAKNKMDSLLLRVNVYDLNGKEVGEKILKKDYYLKIYRNDKNVEIDFTLFQLYTKSPKVLLTIEVLEFYKQPKVEEAIYFSGKLFGKGTNYYRKSSQDKWETMGRVGITHPEVCANMEIDIYE